MKKQPDGVCGPFSEGNRCEQDWNVNLYSPALKETDEISARRRTKVKWKEISIKRPSECFLWPSKTHQVAAILAVCGALRRHPSRALDMWSSAQVRYFPTYITILNGKRIMDDFDGFNENRRYMLMSWQKYWNIFAFQPARLNAVCSREGKPPKACRNKAVQAKGNQLQASDSSPLPFLILNYWDDGRKSVWMHDLGVKLNKQAEEAFHNFYMKSLGFFHASQNSWLCSTLILLSDPSMLGGLKSSFESLHWKSSAF